jgi:CubicO group peptidase (beta-lactamase class C family)
MRPNTWIGLTLFCAAQLYANIAQAGTCTDAAADPRQTALQAAFSESKLPGFCAILITPEKQSCFAGGFADKPTLPYTIDTYQPVGSVSKTLIGLALAQLSEEKKIDLDADIDSYLPWSVRNPDFKSVPITLRQLATHTSSIRDRMVAYRKSYVAQGAASPDLGSYLKSYFSPDGNLFARGNFIRAAPGKTYEYSNIGAALAAYVIEAKLKMPFARYVKLHIFRPIGMQSRFEARVTDARLYKKSGAKIPPYRLVTYPDGGLISSCGDLALYLNAIIAANLGRQSKFDTKVVQRMLAPQFVGRRPAKMPEKITNHGLFWEIRGEKIGHTGSDPGVTALVSFNPITGSARLQLTNIDIEESSSLTQQFIALWQQLE